MCSISASLTDAEQNALSYVGQSRVSEPLPGTHFVSSSLSTLALGKPMVLKNSTFTSLTNVLGKQPVGFSYDFQHDLPTPFSNQLANFTKQLRIHCFPSQHFSKCAIYKGCANLSTMIQHKASEGDGVVVMWQYDQQNPSIYVSSVPWSNLWKDDFDFGQWTIILYWEHKSDSVPEQPNPTDLEDITMPEYGDPDVPMDDKPKDDPQGPSPGPPPRERSRSRDRGDSDASMDDYPED